MFGIRSRFFQAEIINEDMTLIKKHAHTSTGKKIRFSI